MAVFEDQLLYRSPAAFVLSGGLFNPSGSILVQPPAGDPVPSRVIRSSVHIDSYTQHDGSILALGVGNTDLTTPGFMLRISSVRTAMSSGGFSKWSVEAFMSNWWNGAGWETGDADAWYMRADFFPCWMHVSVDLRTNRATIALTTDEAGESPVTGDEDQASGATNVPMAVTKTIDTPGIGVTRAYGSLREESLTGVGVDSWTLSEWTVYGATSPQIAAIAAGKHQVGIV